MKIASSIKSLKKRDLNSKLVKRRGKLYVINKKIQNLKLGRVENERARFQKNLQWFYKVCSLGNCCRNCNFNNFSYYATIKIKEY